MCLGKELPTGDMKKRARSRRNALQSSLANLLSWKIGKQRLVYIGKSLNFVLKLFEKYEALSQLLGNENLQKTLGEALSEETRRNIALLHGPWP